MKISIGNKIFISFFMLNLFVFSLIVFLFVNLFQESNKDFIKFDLIKVKYDSQNYIEQFLTSNEIGFVNTIYENRSELLSELNLKLDVKGVFYDLEGKLIAGDEDTLGALNDYKDDLQIALQKKDAYTIFEKQKSVSLSMPLVVGGEVIGVYRVIKDYSIIFDKSREYSNIILIFGGMSLLFVFIISFIISRSITGPILNLKTVTNKISAQDYETQIDIKSRDEIGDLAYNFEIMRKRVREHIITIQKDKELLSELLDQRKKFFDSVTHELKTPLTVIQGYTQMLAQNGFEDEDFFNKGTTHILEESIRLHKMVLSLLELSELNSLKVKVNFEPFSISELLKKVCESLNIKAKHSEANIQPEIATGLEINGCSDEIKGLFINLIDNSIKYAGKKSIIKVVAFDKGDFVEVMVSDNGVGIPEDKLDKIFEPFYKVDAKKSKEQGGSGLGLSIAKKIVDSHNGSISIKSDVNEGTTVTVTLPKK